MGTLDQGKIFTQKFPNENWQIYGIFSTCKNDYRYLDHLIMGQLFISLPLCSADKLAYFQVQILYSKACKEWTVSQHPIDIYMMIIIIIIIIIICTVFARLNARAFII